ncbi:hypothetical protein JOF34_001409 [Microbacterium amylolyticum]|uniref:Uncharacterized protein n=1 Tax=Microbacterium amylolyticum TaxID=936337 RepID=A0ABS4ZIH3_9MICO|nr:hypothetical protein [Microbacterium amylolyticum]
MWLRGTSWRGVRMRGMVSHYVHRSSNGIAGGHRRRNAAVGGPSRGGLIPCVADVGHRVRSLLTWSVAQMFHVKHVRFAADVSSCPGDRSKRLSREPRTGKIESVRSVECGSPAARRGTETIDLPRLRRVVARWLMLSSSPVVENSGKCVRHGNELADGCAISIPARDHDPRVPYVPSDRRVRVARSLPERRASRRV